MTSNDSAQAARRARSLRTPGTILERHLEAGIMPNWVLVALDRAPATPIRQTVTVGLRVPLVGERVMLVRTKAGDFYALEDTLEDA